MAINNLLMGHNRLSASEAALAGALPMRDHFDVHLTEQPASGPRWPRCRSHVARR